MDPGWGGGGVMDPDLAASAGPDFEVLRGKTGYLLGSYISAPGTNGIEVSWIQISGAPVDIQIPAAPSAAFSAPDVLGPLVFRLRVRSENGWGAPDDVTVEVTNNPPLADAGPDIGAPGGVIVKLQGEATDIDDASLTLAWTQVSGPPVPLSAPDTATPTLALPADLAEPLVYALTVDDGHAISVPDWVTVVRLETPDTDGDLLDDDTESQVGTDPTSPDTDADGIPDRWEVLGHEQVDYPALGCSPLHRDLLVEFDYQAYTDDGGVAHTAPPPPAVRTKGQSRPAAHNGTGLRPET